MTSTTAASAELTGRIVRPGDVDYPAASNGYNRLFAHDPRVIQKGMFPCKDMEVGAAQADMPNVDQCLARSRLRFIARDYVEVKWLTANNGAHNDRSLQDIAHRTVISVYASSLSLALTAFTYDLTPSSQDRNSHSRGRVSRTGCADPARLRSGHRRSRRSQPG